MDSPPAQPTPPRRWHGTLRAERDSARRERLLEAALNLYGTIGFRKTSVQALCQESGVSSRSFYELFPTQESLLEELYIELNNEIITALDTLQLASTDTLFASTYRVVDTALAPMLDDERKARVLEVEVVGISESLENRRHLTMRLLAAAISAAVVEFDQAYRVIDETTPTTAEEVPTTVGPTITEEGPGFGLTSLVLVGGITEVLVQRIHTPPGQRTARGDFLTEIAEVVLRAHGIAERQFHSLPLQGP
ncbi:TetR/AcrR family transcriptional regulator [Brevibacterium spongiae]|uniref:TetR/AcrR family transcriptional regulator n=1 Tax=Brevibacterium spongiae TaxID=2909672 RepID=A0ABY5SR90_9MICO|nr:TetR/AcrR family transcriptional regulator [Brevibacterium spongiae]UVI36820.1 TetR/AcrR family transcriptional regulator [Brevibacterium spongiae]